MSDELVTSTTDLSAFTIDQVIDRMPEVYRAKLRERINKLLASDKKIRIFCDGVFDMFHSGHARLLEQVKKILPNVVLVAGVSKDEDVLAEKGMCVMNEIERAEAVRSCKWVDEVYPRCPWVFTVEFLKSVDCEFTAHDCLPYVTSTCGDSYGEVKEAGYFIPTLRSAGVSSSDMITRILKNRDDFFVNSLNKHMTPSDLNMNWYECLRFGERPPSDSALNKTVNAILDNTIVKKIDLNRMRVILVALICKKKLIRVPEVIFKQK
jgi:cytidyltransferase-like protein